MSNNGFIGRLMQKYSKLRLPEFQAEMAERNFNALKTGIPSASQNAVNDLLDGHVVIIKTVKSRKTKAR